MPEVGSAVQRALAGEFRAIALGTTGELSAELPGVGVEGACGSTADDLGFARVVRDGLETLGRAVVVDASEQVHRPLA